MIFAPELYIHPTSRKLIEKYIADPNHALILHGEYGVGLTTIARSIAKAISRQPVLFVEPIDNKDISIEQVRDLYSLTRSAEQSPKVIIIDEAHRMTMPAQNSFLKLLEEPPKHIYFILVAHIANKLLPTIHSRSAQIEVRQLSIAESEQITTQLSDDSARSRQVTFLAQGRSAEIIKLVRDETYFNNQSTIVRDARAFLQGNSYERLVVVGSYSKNRDTAIVFAEMTGRLLKHTATKQPQLAEKLHEISHAIDRLHENASVKLQLTHLSLTL